jgi:hypothetical protein
MLLWLIARFKTETVPFCICLKTRAAVTVVLARSGWIGMSCVNVQKKGGWPPLPTGFKEKDVKVFGRLNIKRQFLAPEVKQV